MEPNKNTADESINDADIEALLSELNHKRLKLFALALGIIAGMLAGFYGARWLYQYLFPAS